MNKYVDPETGEIKRSSLSTEEITRRLASKSEKYWAEIRTALTLMERSESVTEKQIETAREELSDLLDSGILIYPQTLEEAGLSRYQTLDEKKNALNIVSKSFIRSSNEEKFLACAEQKADTCRKSNWAWRISEEAEQKEMLGWHPFFVTLTVDPNEYDPEKLWKEGRAFRTYIRDLANMVCEQLKHPPVQHVNKKFPNYRKESDYVTYAGVIEHGKSREHHHCHLIIWLRAIPPSWRVCPNAGIRNPRYRNRNECLPLRTFWKYSLPGLSPALYFRTVNDIWQNEYEFCLPLSKKTGKEMKIGPARIAGDYIAKYLAKEHREWHHRMKATRNLGLTKLKSILRTLDEKVVEALTWRASNANLNLSLSRTHCVPLGLLRSEAKRQNFFLKYASNRLDLQTLLLRNSNLFQTMLTSVKDGARPDRMSSLDFFDWVNRCLPVQKGYSDQSCIAAHVQMAQHFPFRKTRVHHIKQRGNDIGHS